MLHVEKIITIVNVKGDKNATSNYRPISLLTSLSKIFERVIYNRIFYHINHNHILVNEQFVFRYALSTVAASYNLTKNILTALNNKLLVGGIFATSTKLLTVLIMTFFFLKWNFTVFLEKLPT